MPTVVPSSQIFQIIEDGAGTTPMSTARAAFTMHRQDHAPAPQPYRGGFVHPAPRPATAPPQQPQARPAPKRPSTPKVRSLLASTASRQNADGRQKYHGTRSDGVRDLLEGRKARQQGQSALAHSG